VIAAVIGVCLLATPCFAGDPESNSPSESSLSANTSLILAVSVEERDPFDVETNFDTESPFYDRFNPPDPAKKRRADTFVLIKAAADNYRFLRWFGAAIRNSESVLDDYAHRFHLKGNLVVAEDGDNGVATRKEIQLGGDIQTTKTNARKSGLAQSPWIPHSISWNLGMDLMSSRISGKLDIGRFLDVEASMGNDSRVIAQIVIPF